MIRPESNGGVSCPDLDQDRKCHGEDCERQTGRHRKHDNSAIRGQYRIVIALITTLVSRVSHDPPSQVQQGGWRGVRPEAEPQDLQGGGER